MRIFKKVAQKTLTMLPAKGGVIKRSAKKGKAAKPAENPEEVAEPAAEERQSEVLMPQDLMDDMKKYFDHVRSLASMPSFQSHLEAMGISPEDAKLLTIGPDFAQSINAWRESFDRFPFARVVMINIYTHSKKSIESIDYVKYRDAIAAEVSKAVDRDSGWSVADNVGPLYAAMYYVEHCYRS